MVLNNRPLYNRISNCSDNNCTVDVNVYRSVLPWQQGKRKSATVRLNAMKSVIVANGRGNLVAGQYKKQNNKL
uniref:Uncharacterized protein n=1 Tax=Trichobilharzia regenti TaxID=157069 RepID=A0AA85JKM8_TRIRE|nr:unnamed protein product [Trichobilharzia regenti]